MFYTTLCLKKVPTFKLSVTLSNLNRFSKFLHCRKAYEICYNTLWHYRFENRLRYDKVTEIRWELFWDTVYISRWPNQCSRVVWTQLCDARKILDGEIFKDYFLILRKIWEKKTHFLQFLDFVKRKYTCRTTFPASRRASWALNTKIRFRPGLYPELHWGVYSAPRSASWILGAASPRIDREGKRKGRKGR